MASSGQVVECKLTGLPKQTEAEQVVRILQDAGIYDPSTQVVIRVDRHKKSSSALLRLSNRSIYKSMCKVLQKGSVRCESTVVPKSKSIAKKEKKKSKKATSYTATSGLAMAFHKHLCQNPTMLQEASDREATVLVFAHFLQNYPDRESLPKQQRNKLTGTVMMRLRQLKLLRTKRISDRVLMTWADTKGIFPSRQDQQVARTRLREQVEEDQQDKFGVVLDLADQNPTVTPGDYEAISIDYRCEQEGVELISLRLKGPQANSFQVLAPARFPLELPAATQVTVSYPLVQLQCRASRMGLHRAFVQCAFESPEHGSFRISRQVLVRSVKNKEMDQALQPTTPYQRKKGKVFEQSKFADIFPAPGSGDKESNPFKSLGYYNVPTEIKEMIVYGDLEDTLEPPTTTKDGAYANFWSAMLWANEQQALKDIQLFDIDAATFQREGRHMILKVPGLAESRPSVLRGDLVHVTWKKNLYKGRVAFVRLLEVGLEFHQAFHRSFDCRTDRAHVRFTMSRMTFRTSHAGCNGAAQSLGDGMLFPDMPVARALPRARGTSPLLWANRNLNMEQQMAVNEIVRGTYRPLPYIIFGPPGTGKTTTVVEAVYQLAKANCKILLVAPSNDASDILVERLSQYFPPSELFRVLAFSRTVQALPEGIRKYADDTHTAQDQAERILSSRIVVATINMAAKFSYFGVPVGHFDSILVDKAGHATEPEVIPVVATLLQCHGENPGQLIMAGDPKQLGPIVTSSICVNRGMEKSYMERLMDREVYGRNKDTGDYNGVVLTKLVQNYRSHPSILGLPNKLFYDNELEACADKFVSHNMEKWEHLPQKGLPVIFHAIDGENLREANSPSWFNPQEAMQVVEYVTKLLKETRPALKAEEIGIITPYHRQAQKIRLALSLETSLADADTGSIKVGSVETFQGQERHVIILSTVRSEARHLPSDLKHHLGFVAHGKRFNVALTRARALLIVIGCPSVLALDKDHWLPFLTQCRDSQSWEGEAWEPEDNDEDDNLGHAGSSEDWDLVEQEPSRLAEEAFAFVHREE